MYKYPSKPLRDLTQDEITAFQNDGAIVARGVLPVVWIERMQKALDDVLANPGVLGSELQKPDKPGRFFGDLFTWLYHDDFRALVFDSPLAELAAQIMQSQRVNFFYDQILVKEPNTPAVTPWHQDLSYWSVQGNQIVSFWVPLDEVTVENGSVIYLKGSHLWPDNYQAVNFTDDREGFGKTEGHLEVIDFDADPEKYPQLTWNLGPGDVLIHHCRTLHSATGNLHPTRRRRAIATRWTGDDATFDPRANTLVELDVVKPHIPDPELKPGDPMGGPLFPQIWPRSH